MGKVIEQLRAAYERSGWTMDELVKRCRRYGLSVDRSTLRRKLVEIKRPVAMRIGEAEIIATALGMTLVAMPWRGKR